MKVRVFNGYIEKPFDVIHQTAGQMETWLTELRECAPDMLTFMGSKLEDCWAYNMVEQIEVFTGETVYSADHPNEPADRYKTPRDALRSQCLLHERFEWLRLAAKIDPTVQTWVWLEPTIFKQRGITHAIVKEFLRDVEDHPADAISLPGIWAKMPITDPVNHWRFAGSCWVCPTQYAKPLYGVVRTLVDMRTSLTHRLCWDNSTWSYIELLNVLPIRWYPGNHDQTQLTHYTVGL